MKNKISKRLKEIVEALPLIDDMRIIEIGCGPGTLAREIVNRSGKTFVLGIDRSAKAILQAEDGSKTEIAAGRIQFQQGAIEDFNYRDGKLFDLAVAIRVGVLDGRHPEKEMEALASIRKLLKPGCKLFIDGGNPLKQIVF